MYYPGIILINSFSQDMLPPDSDSPKRSEASTVNVPLRSCNVNALCTVSLLFCKPILGSSFIHSMNRDRERVDH